MKNMANAKLLSVSSTTAGDTLGPGVHEITGAIIKIRQFDSGWSIASIETEGQNVLSLTGDMPQVVEGMKVKVKAVESFNPKYGLQYKVLEVEETGFSSEEGIIRYLASDEFFGVGVETAKLIVNHFGIDTLYKLDENPESVYDVPGISANRKKIVVENWESARAAHKGLTELLMLGVSATLAKRIERFYEKNTIDIVKNYPYELIKVPGVGFKTADEIALKMGVGRESQVRIKSCILYVLGESEREGHCFLYHSPLNIKLSEELKENVTPGKIVDALSALDKENAIIIEDSKIYLTSLYNAEKEVASILKNILEYKNTPLFNSIDEMRSELKSLDVLDGIKLAPEQEDALFMALNNRVSIITGGPGTGKSTITKALISLFEVKGIRYELCSPTGAAAKRLANATQQEAQTIHRLLGFSPIGEISSSSSSFKYNESNPLTTNCVIVDEISMVDVRLFRHLLCALERNVRLVMVGDSDQLPSVGAGNVLDDLIQSGTVPVTRLKVIFRQKAGNSIIGVAHDIINGVVPVLPTPKKSAGQNCMFVPVSDIKIMTQYIVTLVQHTLPSLGYTQDDIQVLTPMRSKGVGVNDLNPILQAALNPPDSNKPEIQLGFRILRLGDRVMQIRNDYKKIVFNGEVGKICGITKSENGTNVVFVKFPDKSEPIAYHPDELDDIQLSFANTIHKSQGSEYPAVVLAMHTSHWHMLRRNLFYTGLTRAKKHCIIIGTSNAMARAVDNDAQEKRNTTLKSLMDKLLHS
jgi:exodeoxyribonuclease V alpha subunit